MTEIWLWYRENAIESNYFNTLKTHREFSNSVVTSITRLSISLYLLLILMLLQLEIFFSQVYHPDMETYFSGYDGSKYIMQPWLKKLYPHD